MKRLLPKLTVRLSHCCDWVKSRRLIACIVLILSGSAAYGDPSRLPSLGDASSSLISPQLEKRIGQSFLKQINANLNTVDDPLIKYYVTQQLGQLAQHSNLREAILSVVVIDNPSINAFAAPGGVVGINLGLILAAEDVHEYSSVMAHELAHLSQRHFARGVEEQRRQSLPTLASMIAALILGAAGGGDAAIAALSTVQAAAQANQLRFSRERETEADRIGMNTMARAGLDPNAASRMFERMQRTYRFTRKPPEFLLTHPLSETRIADARNQAMNFAKQDYEDSLDYQLMRVRTEVHYRKNHSQGVDTYRKRLQQSTGDLAASYGLALSMSKLGQHEEALSRVEAVYALNPQSILYNAAYAELLIEGARSEQAQSMLRQQLALNPDNPPLSMLYAKAMIAQGRYDDAEATLLNLSKRYPDDVDVWYELAETAGLAGNITGVHLARADFFYLHGAYHRSIQHLEYAKRLVSRRNPQLQAKLNQRIQDMRTAIRIEQQS